MVKSLLQQPRSSERGFLLRKFSFPFQMKILNLRAQ